MAKLSVKQINEEAKKLLSAYPSGMRFTDLWKTLAANFPETNENTIYTSVGNLPNSCPKDIVKPGRGIYQLAELTDKGVSTEASEARGAEPDVSSTATVSTKEQDFYESFANWLRDDLDEVTTAVELRGAGIKTKWGTPDVVGTYKPHPDQLYKFPVELVTAEIKIDPGQSVVHLGKLSRIAYLLTKVIW